jgi:hypothetical protein
MEVAIPLLALGGMYVVSNQATKPQNNENKKEKFTNMGIRTNLATKTDNYLPNTHIPPQNFPVTNLNQLSDTVQEYPNPNVATDKYFDQNLYEEKVRHHKPVSKTIQNVYSLTGNYLDSEQFKHNNMVPFVGGRMRGYDYHAQIEESVLDNMIGAGSQVIKKIEQAPLFKPQQDMQWAYGMPNNTAFYQSRVNPGMKNHNTQPFNSVMVGPGLDKGYTVQGSDGFNAGMEARDKWLPYTVDQLRVSTNPKIEYELLNHEGPANSVIKIPATTKMLGIVEKQRPDTFFINTQDRWLTTTGASKGETLRSIQEMGVIRRNDVLSDYTGPAAPADLKAGHAPENFEPSKRPELGPCDVNHSKAVGRGPITDGEAFLKSHTNYANNRSTLKQPETHRSGFSGAIGAVIAPIMDMLRPSRKEEVVHNVRVYGEAGTTVPGSYVLNPNDTTQTTLKETTMYSPQFNINNQKESMYVNNYANPELTQRDTTSCEYMGSAGGLSTIYGDMNYDAAYRQHNNDIKSGTIVNRPNQGGMQIFNQQMNIHCKDDCDRFDGRVNPAYSRLTGLPPSTNTYGAINVPQYYNECQMCDRIQPEILNAFRSNPYTHPLTTSV